MKYIISRYNHDLSWLPAYTDDAIIYDRSEAPLPGTIVVPNIGSDIYDKLTFIIDNYDNLPEVAVYTKANLFKYITPEEFDAVRNNRCFTPLLTKHHRTYMPICRYTDDGMYQEINNRWYLNHYPAKTGDTPNELMYFLGIANHDYLTFAPGSNYILTKQNILKHPKGFYVKLRGYLDWAVYPGEAQIIERALYEIFK